MSRKVQALVTKGNSSVTFDNSVKRILSAAVGLIVAGIADPGFAGRSQPSIGTGDPGYNAIESQ